MIFDFHWKKQPPFWHVNDFHSQELLSTLEEQKADLEVVEMSGPPRVEQAVDLAEELATVSQKYEMNVNKLKRQKVRFKNTFLYCILTFVLCSL